MGIIVPSPPGSTPVDIWAVKTATLQNAATTDGNGTTFDITGMATVVVTVNPTAYTGTVTFKASQDGTNFDNILGTQLGTTPVASSVANPGSTKSLWVFQTAGLTKFRGILSSSGGTSITVTASASPMPNAVPVGSTIGTAVIQANSGQSTTATSDAATAANILLAAKGVYNGATIDRERTITKFVPLQAVAITHTSPVDVYTPTAGKKFRILGYQLSSTIASAIQFEDGTGSEVLRTPVLAAAGVVSAGPMGNGILSGAANTHIFLDATVTTNVSGWIGICEE